MRFLCVFWEVGIAGQLQAETRSWDSKDGHVAVEAIDTGDGLRVTCTGWVGGDGLPALHLILSNGDAGPPAFYPQPTFYATTLRNYQRICKMGKG